MIQCWELPENEGKRRKGWKLVFEGMKNPHYPDNHKFTNLEPELLISALHDLNAWPFVNETPSPTQVEEVKSKPKVGFKDEVAIAQHALQ